MLLRNGNAIRRSLMVVVASLLAGAWGAAACGGDTYDRNLELQAIHKGLSEAQLTAQDRSEIKRNLDIASVDTKNLSLTGLLLQEIARARAREAQGRMDTVACRRHERRR